MAPNALLNHIYGPYRESTILKQEYPRLGEKISMYDLELNFAGHPTMTGFDHTEFITNPPKNSEMERKGPDVVFFGTIEIDDLDYLSEQGLEFLERDFQDYNRKIHMEHAQTNASIKTHYSQKSAKSNWVPLRVRICCKKTLLAHYMTSKTDFEKFLVYSKDDQKKRTYHVKTIHAATLTLSLKFFARYRLRAMISELIENDPNDVPQEERTVDWVIRRYFEEIRPRDKDLCLYREPGHEYAPRHLRHISRAEIRGYLAEHAEWLLAHMIARKQGSANLLDIPQWISFCKEARRDSLEAAKAGVKWGTSHEPAEDGPYNLARKLAQFGESEPFWHKQLKHIPKRRPSRPTTKPRELSPEAALPENTSEKINFQYDSDFSEVSSSDYSDSEETDSDSSITIPRFCFEEPHIPNGRFVWNCPGCSYHIDLLNLSPENREGLPAATIHGLASKAWKISDKPVQRALFHMVSTHYKVEHLNKQGIECVQTSAETWKVRRIKPVQSKSRPESTPLVKIEEGSQPLRRSSRVSRPRTRSSD